MPKLTGQNESANDLCHAHTLAHSLQKVHPPGRFALEFGGLTPFTETITHLSTVGTAGRH